MIAFSDATLLMIQKQREQTIQTESGWMDGWMDDRMDGWIDDRMGGWVTGWVCERRHRHSGSLLAMVRD
jgi:hypothetical protein